MNFIENVFARMRDSAVRAVLREVRGAGFVPATGAELLALVGAARAFLLQAGVKRGDRCALLAHNSIHWAAVDLAMMAEGIIAVPLYARQAPAELVAMIKDCQASLVCCGDAVLRDAIASAAAAWPEAPRRVLLDEVFAARADGTNTALPLAENDPVTIIYTSGTSGAAKGVVLTLGNVDHMLSCTTARLDLLMGQPARMMAGEPDRVFHYLPFCFAGSWVLLLSCLSRASVLTLSTDLTKLADEIKLADPNYFLNVPALLERVRVGVEEQLKKRGGAALALFRRAQAAWDRRQAGESHALDSVSLALANVTLFPAIRKKLGRNFKALICGSAPLAEETQLFFMMLGIPVLQVYGLTETTAICTMDDPRRVEPGCVGLAISEVEMKLGENGEILVRGPNIFPGYWDRPEETAKVLRNGWFHTGDQGEVNERGNWRITGRLKNLIILSSGHNIAPEPLEEMLLRLLPAAQQVVLIGNERGYLSAIVTGNVAREQVAAEFEKLNAKLPHYKQIRMFHVEHFPFTVENGLLTANGKLKRDAIAARFQLQIEELYDKKAQSAVGSEKT